MSAIMCPKCLRPLNGEDRVTVGADSKLAVPTPGAFAVCGACATLMRYTDSTHVRLCTSDDHNDLRKNETAFKNCLKAMILARMLIEFRRARKELGLT